MKAIPIVPPLFSFQFSAQVKFYLKNAKKMRNSLNPNDFPFEPLIRSAVYFQYRIPELLVTISAQPPSSWHPPLSLSQGQRLSRGRGIYRKYLLSWQIILKPYLGKYLKLSKFT